MRQLPAEKTQAYRILKLARHVLKAQPEHLLPKVLLLLDQLLLRHFPDFRGLHHIFLLATMRVGKPSLYRARSRAALATSGSTPSIS